MVINPSPSVTIQSTEELQVIEESMEIPVLGEEASFENALFAMREEGAELEILPLEEELAEELIKEERFPHNNGLAEELITEEPFPQSNGIMVAALPPVLAATPLRSEEPVFKTAQIDPVMDHSQSQFLPNGDGAEQLKGQVEKMAQAQTKAVDLAAITSGNAPEAQGTAAPGKENINLVLHSVQPEEAEGIAKQSGVIDKSIPVSTDPRVSVTPTGMERAKVSIEEQLNRANAQLDIENNGNSAAKVQDTAVLTSGAILHQTEVEQEESVMKRQLMQQFRQITPSENLQSATPQPLSEFSENIHFNQAVNPSGKPNDFASKPAASKSSITRNIPEISEIFVKPEQKTISREVDSSPEIDTGFEQVWNELNEKTETTASRESRLTVGADTTRTTSKDMLSNLDQIMSKVNFKEEGSKEVTMQLTPRELGEMTMKIRQQDNHIVVEMIVASLEAKQMLESNLPELRSRFLGQEDASFDQLQFSVDVEQHSFSESGQAPEHGSFEGDYQAGKQQAELDSKVSVSQQYQKAGYNSGVSIYA